jgi:hypothetical protein
MIMKRIVYIMFWFVTFAPAAGYSYAQDYRYIDSVMRICPPRQTRSAENIAKYINDKFKSENDRLRAAYSWVAQHISYDVGKMYTGVKYQHESEVVTQVLNSRKTICFGYVVTLKAIADNLGIKIVVVQGYTKQNGKIDAIPHSWCAVKYNDNWSLIDPTWSAGYLSSGVFHKKFNDKWYLVQPEAIITSHISFDPVWQFSYFPVNGSEFASGTRADSITSRFFSYPDTVKIIGQLSEKERLIAENRRILAMGDKNNMVAKHVETNKASIELIVHNEHVSVFNEAVKLYNEATSLYNKNNLKAAKPKLDEAAEMINSIRNPNREMSASIKELKKMINSFKSQIEKES